MNDFAVKRASEPTSECDSAPEWQQVAGVLVAVRRYDAYVDWRQALRARLPKKGKDAEPLVGWWFAVARSDVGHSVDTAHLPVPGEGQRRRESERQMRAPAIEAASCLARETLPTCADAEQSDVGRQGTVLLLLLLRDQT